MDNEVSISRCECCGTLTTVIDLGIDLCILCAVDSLEYEIENLNKKLESYNV